MSDRSARSGCVHIYHGDGKGKTTAAIGLAMRAAGRGLRVRLLRLLKTDDSGEVDALKQIPGITVIPCERCFGFTFRMTPEVKEEAARYYTGMLRASLQAAKEGECDLLIVDEYMAAAAAGLVPEQELLDFLDHRPEQLEVVLTGRDPSDELKRRADYISEVRMEKHPYTRGLAAREGIEY
jgi:cob(I)alamin adenosyltransferase